VRPLVGVCPAAAGKRNMPLPFDDERSPLYGVSQVADMLDVQPAFLRRLDTHQVVSPARSSGDQRRYSKADILRIQEVVALVAAGYTLVSIRAVFDLKQKVAALQEEVIRLRARKRS
jgi:MerR family transcriptional regulator/heat shock protein HspR